MAMEDLEMKSGDHRERSFTSGSPLTVRPCANMTLLLLDDDDDFRNALSDLLSEDGHSVHAYRSINEMPPLDQLPAPAALIIDYDLGASEDGLGFAERFNAVHPDVPVIIVTAYISDHLTQSVAATPYLSLLRKPVRYEALHELLHKPPRTGGS